MPPLRRALVVLRDSRRAARTAPIGLEHQEA
jgi:hypothetical protein